MAKNSGNGLDITIKESADAQGRSDHSNDPNDSISQTLRLLYSQAEQQTIPDRFLDLLEKLDEVEQANKSSEEK